MNGNVKAGFEYKTKDFWLCASLVAAGQRVQSLVWEGAQATFIFTEAFKCEELESAYWGHTLKVSALDMTNAMRDLKNRMYNSKENK